MQYDVVALGEILMDITQNGVSPAGNPVFEANPGGAPCNVLAMLSRQGKKTAFIGKVGSDAFGKLLINAVKEAGIFAENITADSKRKTTLAFVSNKPDGDREFSFYRHDSADTAINKSEVDISLIENTKIFHFGSLSLTHKSACEATELCVKTAQKMGKIITFDPNLRPLLWENSETAKQKISWGCSVCHVLKLSLEELEFLTGCNSTLQGAEALRRLYPQIKIIFITLGKNGSECFIDNLHVSCQTYLQLKAVDTTGAGDTFFGSCLYKILQGELDNPSKQSIYEVLRFANAAASIVASKKGTIKIMPNASEILQVIQSGNI